MSRLEQPGKLEWDELSPADRRARLEAARVEWKLLQDGAISVNAARSKTQVCTASQLLTKSADSAAKTGRKRDGLVDDLVFEVLEDGKKRVYCIGCLDGRSGRDTARIRTHAAHCQVRTQFTNNKTNRLTNSPSGGSCSLPQHCFPP